MNQSTVTVCADHSPVHQTILQFTLCRRQILFWFLIDILIAISLCATSDWCLGWQHRIAFGAL